MGFLRRLFGGATPTESGPMSPQEAEEIIQAYGATLETQAPMPGCVADSDKLPFSKERIKAALVIGLKATHDPQMKAMLKVGYMQLADWQEGIGPVDAGLDLSTVDPHRDPMEAAQQVVQQGSTSEEGQGVAAAAAEREELQQELVDLGLW